MIREKLHSCPELIDCINEVGFLPLLRMGGSGLVGRGGDG